MTSAILPAEGTGPNAVRAFLDGRHFADEVSNHLHAGAGLADATARATETFMAWRIGRRTSRGTGFPAGVRYPTGFVLDVGIAAEVAAA